jgi:hypothetical protein
MSVKLMQAVDAPPSAPQFYDSQGFGNSGVVSTSATVLYKLSATNKSASNTLFIQLFDAATVPGNGAVPLMMPLAVAPSSTAEVSLAPQSVGAGHLLGLPTSSGLVWAVSTTAASLTLDSTSSVWASVWYV